MNEDVRIHVASSQVISSCGVFRVTLGAIPKTSQRTRKESFFPLTVTSVIYTKYLNFILWSGAELRPNLLHLVYNCTFECTHFNFNLSILRMFEAPQISQERLEYYY